MGLSSKRSVTPPFQGGDGGSNPPSPTKPSLLTSRLMGYLCGCVRWNRPVGWKRPRMREPVVDTDAVGHMVIRSCMKNQKILPSEDSL